MAKDKNSLIPTFIGGAFIGVVIILIVVFGGKNSSNSPEVKGQKTPISNYQISVNSAPTLGPADAKVVVSEYSDFECPYCEKQAKEIIPALHQEYAGKVKFVFRQFPIPGHDIGEKVALASICAQDQGKFWEFRDLISKGYPAWRDDIKLIDEYAKSIGLDITKFNSCRTSQSPRDFLKSEFDAGVKMGVDSTPTIYINNEKIVGAESLQTYESKIDALLNK